MSSEFPNELWTEVFGGVSQTDLIQVASASRAFCALARPLLFADFTFHPYTAYEKMQFATERLNFWMSGEVAVLVRTCTIAPWPFSSFVKKHWVGIYGEAAYVLLDAFVDKMERFIRMRCLRVLDVDFPPLAPTKLAAMPSLRELAVSWESPNDVRREFTVSRAIPLTSFTYFSNTVLTRDPSPYLSLLDPAHLRQLTVFCFSDVARKLTTFPSVNKFKMLLDLSGCSPSNLVAILSKVPNVESVVLNLTLRLRWKRPVMARASATRDRTFPSVKNISIPVQILPAMLALCPSVVLLNLLRCDVVPLLSALESVQTCPTMRVLSLHITDVEAETQYDFSSMLAPFPGLTGLFIHLGILTGETNSTVVCEIDGQMLIHDPQARQLFTALTPALPQTLRELTLCFSFTHLDNNQSPATNLTLIPSAMESWPDARSSNP
ncbi:hypothetical protein C8F01DRAFT_1262560 [Mycena amicta]|nr:hypothetical protein C8F01DRAFT_1262560 [Mycena amicta]